MCQTILTVVDLRHQPSSLPCHLPSSLLRHLPSSLLRHQPSLLLRHQPSSLLCHQPSSLLCHQPSSLLSAVVTPTPGAIVGIRRRFRGNLQRERIFRDRTNPLEIDDVELHAKFRFTRVHILSINIIVDDVREAIEYTTTRQGSLSALLQVFIAFAILCEWMLPESGRGDDRGRQVDGV